MEPCSRYIVKSMTAGDIKVLYDILPSYEAYIRYARWCRGTLLPVQQRAAAST